MKLSEFKNKVIELKGNKMWEQIENSIGYKIYTAPEEEQLDELEEDGTVIQYIKNPTEEMKVLAVKETIQAMNYIDDPSEEVQLEAIKKDPRILKNIKKPTEKVIRKAIKGINEYYDFTYILKHLENNLNEE